jgi:hypothetical protein
MTAAAMIATQAKQLATTTTGCWKSIGGRLISIASKTMELIPDLQRRPIGGPDA